MVAPTHTLWRKTLLVVVAAGCGAPALFGQNPAARVAAPSRTEGRSSRRPVDTRPATSPRDPARMVRVAVVQAGEDHSAKGNPGPEANFNLLAGQAREAAASQPRPDLICFPEYTLAGWPYPEEEQANGLAEAVPGDGPWYRRYRDLARELGVPLLASLVELDRGRRYNTACLLDRQGRYRGKYRKVHATLGEQGWWGWSKGQRYQLLELDGVRYGISICADMWFPETVRCEELLGADVILHQSIGDDMGRIVPTRAFDSKLPIVMTIFRGGSYAVDAEGNLLGKLPANKPGWKVFSLQPFRPHLGRKYGGVYDEKKTIHNLRSPAAYSILIDPSTRPPWTEVFMDAQGRPQTQQQIRDRFQGHYDDDDPDALDHAPSVPMSRPE
jgi:predicted amidohydrolase